MYAAAPDFLDLIELHDEARDAIEIILLPGDHHHGVHIRDRHDPDRICERPVWFKLENSLQFRRNAVWITRSCWEQRVGLASQIIDIENLDEVDDVLSRRR